MDVVSDFKRTIEKNTANSMNILNKVYKKKEINSRKEFIREINKYYTGLRVLFQYTSGEEKQVQLLNNILLNMCSLLNCVIIGDIRLIYFLYRNTIESFLRYISQDYAMKNLEDLFACIDNGSSGIEKNILTKYKSQIKYIYSEACKYIHTDINKVPENINNMKRFNTYVKRNLKEELKYFRRLSILIISIIKIKYPEKYMCLKANAKAYIDDIIPLEKRTEYQDILDEKNKQDRKY